MRLCILSLIDEALEYLLVLEQGSAGLEPKCLIKLALIVLSELQKHLHVGLLEGFQIGLTRGHELLLMLVPVALEITDVILALLKQLVHLNVILG